MAIDPNIIANVGQPGAGYSPLDAIERVGKAQDARQTRQDEQAKREQAALIQRTLQQHANDPDAAIEALRGVNVGAAMALEKDLIAKKKALIDSRTAEIGNDLKEAELFAKWIGDGSEPAWQNASVFAKQSGNQEAIQLFSQPYNPQMAQQLRTGGLSEKDKLEAEQKALESKRLEDWAAFVDSDPEEAEQAARVILGPAKWEELKGQAATRAETRRSNLADEDTARGNLSVSQGNLGVAQGNLSQRRLENQSGTPSASLNVGDQKLVEAVMKNPALYARLTPTVATRIAAALSEKGFNFDAPAAKSGAAAKDGPNVGAIINQIETLSNRINTLPAGPMSTISGMVRRGAAGANMDNDVSEYNSLVEGMIPMIARAVGHTGVLTQQDVDSVRALFPKVGDNKTLAQNKIKRVRELMAGAGSPGAAATTPPPSGGSRFEIVSVK